MNSFYSILTVPIRPSSQEQLNIGLLLFDERNLLFKFSNRKLDFIKKLLPENSFNLLKAYVFGLAEKLNSSADEKWKSKFSSTEFIGYLSSYNNNLIIFSKPTAIELETNDVNYKALFERFVFQFDAGISQEPSSYSVTIKDELKYNLYPRIKERVNWDQTITTKEIPTLLVPSVKVNFIGQNDLPLAGQILRAVRIQSQTAYQRC